MGFLSRLLVPRGVRRAMHPVRSAKRAMTPKSVKRVRRAMNPVGALTYAVERDVATAIRGRKRRSGRASAYMHGNCPVRHRTVGAAQRCRNL
jgi:hypothetical protein